MVEQLVPVVAVVRRVVLVVVPRVLRVQKPETRRQRVRQVPPAVPLVHPPHVRSEEHNPRRRVHAAQAERSRKSAQRVDDALKQRAVLGGRDNRPAELVMPLVERAVQGRVVQERVCAVEEELRREVAHEDLPRRLRERGVRGAACAREQRCDACEAGQDDEEQQRRREEMPHAAGPHAGRKLCGGRHLVRRTRHGDSAAQHLQADKQQPPRAHVRAVRHRRPRRVVVNTCSREAAHHVRIPDASQSLHDAAAEGGEADKGGGLLGNAAPADAARGCWRFVAVGQRVGQAGGATRGGAVEVRTRAADHHARTQHCIGGGWCVCVCVC
eukprot:Rhum_TRINITY_DN15524_c0_g1::Rhum_TRINITY_DN15524_c0_g1_i1::g.161110::m.161110